MKTIVVGAGAAGLMAALELAKNGKEVLILEARERAGGRMFTGEWNAGHQPPELGAEFVHGKLPISLDLFKRANIRLSPAGGRFYRLASGELIEQDDFLAHADEFLKKAKALKEDMSVDDFLMKYFTGDNYADLRETLSNYVSGYYAGELDKTSMKALYEEFTGSDEEQYRVDGGYKGLYNYLLKELEAWKAVIHYREPVTEIHVSEASVDVITNSASYKVDQVLVTIPVGLWQQEAIRFTPALPEKTAAARALGYGPVVRITVLFKEAFWKEKKQDLGFVFSQEAIPTWWTQNPREETILTGWAGGFHARMLEGKTDDELKELALLSLSNIFRQDVRHLLLAFRRHNWMHDPYSMGAYSYQVLNGFAHQTVLEAPVMNRLFVAGEGLSRLADIGTVEAALRSGLETAKRMCHGDTEAQFQQS